MECSSVKKEQNICYDKDEPQQHAKGKKPDANDHTSYDWHMKCPQERSQKQKEDLSLSRAASGNGE